MGTETLREQRIAGQLDHGWRLLVEVGGRCLEMKKVGQGLNAHRAGIFYSASIWSCQLPGRGSDNQQCEG